jgi:hypothetical protein
MMSEESHSPEEVLERYAMRSLSEDESETLEDHLMFCRQCQMQLEQIESFLFAARQASRKIREEPRQPAISRAASRFRISGWLKSPKQLTLSLAGLALVLCSVFMLRQPANQPFQQVKLDALRDAESNEIHAGQPLELLLNLSGMPPSPSYRVEIVDLNGSTISSSSVQVQSNSLTLRTDSKLPPGQYWVRLYLPDSTEPAREFALRAR